MKYNKKKIIIISIIVMLIISIGCIGISHYININKVVTTITLDINPSIEIELNKKNQVINVKTLTSDIPNIDIKKYKRKPIDDLLYDITTVLIENGFVKENKMSILLNVEGNNIKDSISNSIKEIFKERKIDYDIIVQESNKELADKAEQYNISNSKASYIEEIIKENPEYKFEDLTDSSINELSKIGTDKKVDEEEQSSIEENEDIYNTNNEQDNINNEVNNNNQNDNVQQYGEDLKCSNYKIESDEAVNTAILDAGLSNEYVPSKNGYLSEYNDICAYEVTFRLNKTEYIYYIDSISGNILYKNSVLNTKVSEGEINYIVSQDLTGGQGTSPTTFSPVEKTTYNGIIAFKVTATYEGISHTYYINEVDGSILAK